ncbi:hypothetical protein BKA62DRAFT_699676 [Auriculariales sp. MPI-PUGE-AT-0066]|nr:hypothetical protein BKA62DRAFT_699676 [Auriculariales sp. MPI-PUGE-AT-0066]
MAELAFFSETSAINPKNGREWGPHDKLRCMCGKMVKVGVRGYPAMAEHHTRTKHKNALRRKIEASVAARDSHSLAGYAQQPAAVPQPQLPPPLQLPPDLLEYDIIRYLRRRIHTLPSEMPSASHDGPLAGLIPAGDVPDDMIDILPPERAEDVILHLFGPAVSDETLCSYVARGVNGLDGLARWLRLQAYSRVHPASLDPLHRLFTAIDIVLQRLTLPSGEAVAGPSTLPIHTSPGPRIPVLVKPFRVHTPYPSSFKHLSSTGSDVGHLQGDPLLSSVSPPAGQAVSTSPAFKIHIVTPTAPHEFGGCPICGPRLGTFKNAPEQLTHMSAHILLDDRVPLDACAFCLGPSSDGCSMLLRQYRTQFDMQGSVCPRKPDRISYLPASRSVTANPCSNVPYACPLCPYDDSTPCIWKYSMQRHLLERHPGVDVNQYRAIWEVADSEIGGMKKVLQKAYWKASCGERIIARGDVLHPANSLRQTSDREADPAREPETSTQAGHKSPIHFAAATIPSQPDTNGRHLAPTSYSRGITPQKRLKDTADNSDDEVQIIEPPAVKRPRTS